MKKPMIMIATAIVAAVCLADQKPATRTRPKRFMKPTGGIIEQKQMSKVFRVLNTTTVVPVDKVTELTRDMRYSVQLPIEVVSGEKPTGCPFEAADGLVAGENVAAGLLIVEDAKMPMVLVAPDRKWGILNLAPIKVDNPAPEKLYDRFVKLYWNALGRSLGAGNSVGCVIVPFSTMAELDAIKAKQPSPEAFNKMLDTGHTLGMKTLTIATYRTACEKGWAPQPTNAEQKVIWDEVHKLPTEPIKIKPETKKVTE